ncbi:MAG: DUF4406 domain-containing protein [Bacteroidota bacterium]|nr:DUF4406 domain-containing protein [Bacteroidota bacterium]
MKIYISGKISGLDIEQAQKNFDNAEQLISAIGLTPVNPLKNGLTLPHSWEQHLLKDIENLMDCDGILMLENWLDSKGARIENNIANEMGKVVLYESFYTRDQKGANIIKIQKAISEVINLKPQQYISEIRRREYFYARMIFIWHCKQAKMTVTEIAKSIRREHTTVLYCLKKYEEEKKYNKNFREIALKIEEILNRK